MDHLSVGKMISKIVVTCLLLFVSLSAETLTLQHGDPSGGTVDASIATSVTNFALDGEIGLSLRDCALSSTINRRILIKWPQLDSIPAMLGVGSVIVTSAKYKVKTSTWQNIRFVAWTGTVPVYLHEVVEAWDTIGTSPLWSNQPSADSTVILDSILVDSSQNTWYEFDLPVALVQSWINSPATNYGVMLRAKETGSDIESSDRSFYSADANPDSVRPILELEVIPVSVYIADGITFQGNVVIGP